MSGNVKLYREIRPDGQLDNGAGRGWARRGCRAGGPHASPGTAAPRRRSPGWPGAPSEAVPRTPAPMPGFATPGVPPPHFPILRSRPHRPARLPHAPRPSCPPGPCGPCDRRSSPPVSPARSGAPWSPPAPVGSAELAPVPAPGDAARQEREARYQRLLEQGCTADAAAAGGGPPARGVESAARPGAPAPEGGPRRHPRGANDRAGAHAGSHHPRRRLGRHACDPPPGAGPRGLPGLRIRRAGRGRRSACGAWRASAATECAGSTTRWTSGSCPRPTSRRLAADPAAYVERER